EAISIANDRAESIDDDPPANGFGCARELWRSMGWLLPGAPSSPLRETITTSCGYARVALETLLREHPGSPNESYGCSVLVGLLLADEDFAAGEGLAVRCHNPWALYNVAHHLDERGLSAEAARWFARALSATDDPQLVGQANHRLGLLRLEAGDHLGAVAHFEASMAAAQLGENERGYALANARLLLARGTWSPEETATRIGAAVRSWEQYRVFADVLVALAAAGRIDWALAGFRHLRRVDPENAEWALDEALLLGELSSRREAIAAYDRLLRTTSERGSFSSLWHPIYVAAARWHREALRATPPDREQLRDAARLYALVGTAWRSLVPNWSRSVFPGRPELRSLYQAEALFEAGDACDAAYLEALRDDAEPALAPEIRCKAALCRGRRSDALPTTR
ncbi:MAG: hypothetical protein JWM10_3220, partial [Myxococcaceae bacterium]|nr:hypothetical protein [Myxococcaceae bacterium]